VSAFLHSSSEKIGVITSNPAPRESCYGEDASFKNDVIEFAADVACPVRLVKVSSLSAFLSRPTRGRIAYLLGMDDPTMQGILRHSTVVTTQNHHIKTARADSVAAMRRLSESLECSNSAPESGNKIRLIS
jgi:hypothetical protein